MQAIECLNLKKFVEVNNQPQSIVSISKFTVEKGEQIALMGPSGSGKTSLLKILAGLDIPSEGAVSINGQLLNKMSKDSLERLRANDLGVMLQDFHLFPYMTAVQNVLLQTLATSVKSKKDYKERAISLLSKMKLADRLYHPVKKLSKGEQQRVALSRALLHEPSILLIDEPTSNLDARTGIEMIELIQQMATEQNCTVVVVTHDIEVAKKFNRIEYMNELNNSYSSMLKEVLV